MTEHLFSKSVSGRFTWYRLKNDACELIVEMADYTGAGYREPISWRWSHPILGHFYEENEYEEIPYDCDDPLAYAIEALKTKLRENLEALP